MTLAELLEEARYRLDDAEEPGTGESPDSDSLWKTVELIRYLNEAIREAAQRSFLIVDDTTEDVATVDVVAGTYTYTLDPVVILVKRAVLDSLNIPLASVTERKLDKADPDWRNATGTPTHYYQRPADRLLGLYPNPTTNDALTLTVARLPLANLSIDDDTESPEIPVEYHDALLHWVYYRCFRRKDRETFNPAEAEMEMAKFEDSFGKRRTANDLAMAASVPRFGGGVCYQ